MFHDNLPTPVTLGAIDHGRWVLGASLVRDELDGDPLYYVAKLRDGTPWLVASHEDWHWN